jgi:hypothetical protein
MTQICGMPSLACFTNHQPTMGSTGRPGQCRSCLES